MYNFARYIFLVVFFCAGTLVSCAEDDPLETKGAATQGKTTTDIEAKLIALTAANNYEVEVEHYGRLQAAAGTGAQGSTCVGETLVQFYHGGYYGIYQMPEMKLQYAAHAPLLADEVPHCWIANHYITENADTILMYAGFVDTRNYYMYRKNGYELELERVLNFFPSIGKTPNYVVDYPNRKFYVLSWGDGKIYLSKYSFEDDYAKTIGQEENIFYLPSIVHTLQDVLFCSPYIFISYGDGTSYVGYVKIDLENLTYQNINLINQIPGEEPEGLFEYDGNLYWVTSALNVYKIKEPKKRTQVIVPSRSGKYKNDI